MAEVQKVHQVNVKQYVKSIQNAGAGAGAGAGVGAGAGAGAGWLSRIEVRISTGCEEE